jgi:hypothetical protein
MIMGKVRVVARMRWFALFVGMLLGALIVLGIRFGTYSPEHVHYHANFAVFINGQREEFKAPKYYQEVAICSASHDITSPQQRVHMHDEENDVVHVHDHVVTWGNFFQSIGWNIGPDYLIKDDGTKYVESGADKLNITIDGKDYTDLGSITNMVIVDKSKVLVSFGDIDAPTLQQEYQAIPSTAAKHDADKDPSSCSGDESPTISDRLHHLL